MSPTVRINDPMFRYIVNFETSNAGEVYNLLVVDNVSGCSCMYRYNPYLTRADFGTGYRC
jgi:hypothetical protein